MAYTPSTTFDFSGGSYTPSSTFDFTTGPASENIGDIAAALDDVAGVFFGSITVQGDISAALDDVTGDFVGNIHLAGIIDGQLDDVAGDFSANQYLNQGLINAVLDDVVGGVIGNYDPNVQRWVTADLLSDWQDTGQVGTKALMSRDQAARTDHKAGSVQQNGLFLTTETYLDTDQAQRLDHAACSAEQKGTNLQSVTAMVREQGIKIHRSTLGTVETALKRDLDSAVVMQQMTKVYPDRWVAAVQDTANTQTDFKRLVWLEPPPEHQYTPQTTFSFSDTGYTPDPLYVWDYGETAYLATGHNLGVARNEFNGHLQPASDYRDKLCSIIEIARRPPPGKSPWIDLPRSDPDPEPPSGETFEVPIRETYTMNFNVSVTLEDLTEIDVDNIKLDFDRDSFAWQFSAELLDADQIPLIKPLPDGSAVKLIVTLNSYVWHVLVEKLPHKRRFGEKKTTITGRGLSAELAAPYYQATTGLQGSLLAIQQLAALHVPNGWTLNWQQVTWNVPGGAYSYQNRTPIQAIADIADAAGAFVRPSRDSKVLDVIPVYPVLPWNFGSVSLDVAIPEDIIVEVTHRDTSRQYANGVYVHGAETGGEIGFCRLNGTAGDVLMQTYSNPLMTDVVGIRAQGERLLASEFTQPDIEGLTVPLDNSTMQLLEVGTFIGATIDGIETRGIVNALSLSARRDPPEIYQTVRIGEDTNNQWIAFQTLLPKDPLLIGTLKSTDGSVSTMQLIDGGVMNVRGTGNVGEKYYIRSGQIQGEAPNMNQSEVVI